MYFVNVTNKKPDTGKEANVTFTAPLSPTQASGMPEDQLNPVALTAKMFGPHSSNHSYYAWFVSYPVKKRRGSQLWIRQLG